MENVIKVSQTTKLETCIHLKKEDEEEMRVVGVPKGGSKWVPGS